MDNIFAKNLVKIDEIVKLLCLDGYSLVNQIILFHDYIVASDLNNEQKSKIILKIADVDQNLIKVCDEYIQFIRLVYYIVNTI